MAFAVTHSLLAKMGFDCGFDIFPTLEPTPLNTEKFDLS